MMRVVLVLALLAGLLISPVSAQTLAQRLSGKILLQVESKGEAWYVDPVTLDRYYLGRPDDAFRIMRELGLGISNSDLALIPESTSSATGNLNLRNRLSGRILLQVEAKGEAWYVNPDNVRRYYLGRPADAFSLMRQLGLGISDVNLASIPMSEKSASPNGNGSLIPLGQHGLLDNKDAARNLVLGHLNAERARLGLSPYALQNDLSKAAQLQADDMTALGYASSTSPSGKTITGWVEDAGYEPKALAENIAQTNIDSVNLVHVWKDQSEGSYQNVVSSEYEHVGVGVGQVDGLDVYVVVFAKSFATHFAEETASLQNLDAVRSEMLQLVNQARVGAGVPPLTMNAILNASAQAHAQDMFDRHYYSHQNPEGLTSYERIIAQGYEPKMTAENIAKNQFSVVQVMESWLESPSHRANLLDADLEEVGFGLAFGENNGEYQLLWVQNFGTWL